MTECINPDWIPLTVMIVSSIWFLIIIYIIEKEKRELKTGDKK